MLYPQPDSIALILPPSLPLKKFLPNLPSVLACPITAFISLFLLNRSLFDGVFLLFFLIIVPHVPSVHINLLCLITWNSICLQDCIPPAYAHHTDYHDTPSYPQKNTPSTSSQHSPYTQTHTSYAPYSSLYTPPPGYEYCRSYPCHKPLIQDPACKVQRLRKYLRQFWQTFSDGTT